MKVTSSPKLAEHVFGQPFNETLVHQVVVAHMAGGRQGTKAQKTRSDVSGGGAKPWRQKGTGRARAGTRTSPIWRGGGATFAARPRNYSQKVNRKMYQGAMRSILSELARQERLIVVDDFKVTEPKTKAVVAQLKELDLNHALIIVDQLDPNSVLATRNIPNIALVDVNNIDPVSLVNFEKVVVTEAAVAVLGERFK